MAYNISSINSDTSSQLAGLPVVLMLTNSFLVNSKFTIESLLTWMNSFYQEFQAGEQSSSTKYTWLLVCLCRRCYFNELKESRTSTSAAPKIPSLVKRTGSYIFERWHNHIVSRQNMYHRWHEHSTMVRVINYHPFRLISL